MRVTRVLDHWLEAGLRERRWMRIPVCAARVRKELRQFLTAIEGVVELES